MKDFVLGMHVVEQLICCKLCYADLFNTVFLYLLILKQRVFCCVKEILKCNALKMMQLHAL